MKPNATQQEILLVTGTRFLGRQCFEAGEKEKLTEREQLHEACWNGLILDMLPEIIEQPRGEKLFLWQVKEATSFIGIELCEFPDDKESCFSIDPYSFIPDYFLS
jgi:hypothetical protein